MVQFPKYSEVFESFEVSEYLLVLCGNKFCSLLLSAFKVKTFYF